MAQGTTRGVPIDIDPLLTADSDLLVPSQKAAKSYIDNGLSNKQNALGFTAENVANKENTTLDTSTTKYPTNRLTKEYADSKVADSITNGVTTIAPSQNAVFDALALKQRKLFNLTPQVTHTGTTAKTIITTFYIPANTFTAGDFLNFSAIVAKTSGAATTHNLEINTTNTLTGATIISTVGFGTTNATMKFKREIVLNGGSAFVLNVSTGTPNDNIVGVNATVLSQFTYNLAADLYFFVTCTLTLTTDNIIYRGIQITD
jgi:hypothetical protein